MITGEPLLNFRRLEEPISSAVFSHPVNVIPLIPDVSSGEPREDFSKR